MKMKINSIILFIFLSSFVFSQEKDSQTWSTLSIDKKIVKKTEMTLKQSFRLENNSSFLYKYFTDSRIKYNYNKMLSVSIGFRYINEREIENNWLADTNTENKNRYYSDLHVKQNIDRFKLSLRNRLQKQGVKNDFNNTFRQKLSIDYNIKKSKLKPIFSTEYFYKKEEKIIKIRYSLGLEYPVIKNLNFYLGYRFQKEVNVSDPLELKIFEVKINYNLK